MFLKSQRCNRWAVWTMAVCLAVGLGALAQDEIQVEREIIIKTDNVDIPDRTDTVIIEQDSEQSGIKNMVETIMDSVSNWVDASADAVHQLAGAHRSRVARSEGGNTRDIDLSKNGFSDGKIKIYNISGKVVVKGWNRNEISVEGHLGQDVDRLDFDVSSHKADIRVVVPRGRSRKIRSELIIHVPMHNTVEIETVSASIEVEGIQGDRHEIESVSGSIKINDTSGKINVTSVSGKIAVDDANADIEAESVSGSIQINGDYPNAEVETVSGPVKIYGARKSIRAETVSGSLQLYGDTLEDLNVETVSGSITYTGGLAERGDIRANSLSGSIRLQLDRPVEGEYELETFSGNIRCDLGPSSISRNKGKGKHIIFTNGDGKARIKVETFSGSLTISTE